MNDSGCLGTIIKLIAVFLVIFFIITLPFTILGQSISQVIFSQEYLKELAQETLLGTGFLEQFFIGAFFEGDVGPGGDDFEEAFQYLTPAEQGEILRNVVPEGWASAQIDSAIDEVYLWIDDDRYMPEIALDLVPIKDHLINGGIERSVEILIDSWPSCSPEQINQLRKTAARGGELQFDICEPPEPFRTRAFELVTVMMYEWVRETPSSMEIGEEPDQSYEEVMELKGQIRFLRTILQFGWFLPIALLGLLMALSIRSFRDLGTWWGIPLIIGGGFTIFMTIIFGSRWEQTILGGLPSVRDAGELLEAPVRIAVDEVLGAIVGQSIFLAMICIVLGGGLFGLSRVLGRKEPKVPTQVKEAGSPTEPIDIAKAPPEVRPMDVDDSEEPPSGIFG